MEYRQKEIPFCHRIVEKAFRNTTNFMHDFIYGTSHVRKMLLEDLANPEYREYAQRQLETLDSIETCVLAKRREKLVSLFHSNQWKTWNESIARNFISTFPDFSHILLGSETITQISDKISDIVASNNREGFLQFLCDIPDVVLNYRLTTFIVGDEQMEDEQIDDIFNNSTECDSNQSIRFFIFNVVKNLIERYTTDRLDLSTFRHAYVDALHPNKETYFRLKCIRIPPGFILQRAGKLMGHSVGVCENYTFFGINGLDIMNYALPESLGNDNTTRYCNDFGAVSVFEVTNELHLLDFSDVETVKNARKVGIIYTNSFTIDLSNTIIRKSTYDTDRCVAEEMCERGFDGFVAQDLAHYADADRFFPGEFALCNAVDNIKFIKTYDSSTFYIPFCNDPAVKDAKNKKKIRKNTI
uniref:Uncharacterized protein n=1 Tax=viral metagenome TaxID=1070528 RepID=A0A6C0KFS5_9ZZZZ